jgi:hypothetical protein
MLANLKSRISNQPFDLYLVTALLLFVFSFVVRRESLDFHLHDTYFVISTLLCMWALAITSIIVWAIHKLTSRILWKRFLIWFHVIVTIFCLLALLTAIFWHDKLVHPIKRELVSFETFEQDRQREANLILPLIFLLLAGQLALYTHNWWISKDTDKDKVTAHNMRFWESGP